MNLAVWQERLKVAFNAHNLAVLAVAALLLLAFTFGLVLPAFQEAERLTAEIPAEEQRIGQTREIHRLADDLRGKLAELQAAAPPPPGEFGPRYQDSPVALRQLAAEHGVEVRELVLELPSQGGQGAQAAQTARMELRAELVGPLEPLRRVALEMAWLPALVELKKIAIKRQDTEFRLVAVLVVADE